jgi:ubiquinone/menaquinone biosynthesis C-methylase UbiE
VIVHSSVVLFCSTPQVVDVGGGTGFCTLGVVKTVPPENVTLIDQ